MDCNDCGKKLLYNDKRYPVYVYRWEREENNIRYRCNCCYYKYRKNIYRTFNCKDKRVR